MRQATDNKNRNKINKGACATCVRSLVWHEVWAGRLIYHGEDKSTVVGFQVKWGQGLSDRFTCPEHKDAGLGVRYADEVPNTEEQLALWKLPIAQRMWEEDNR